MIMEECGTLDYIIWGARGHSKVVREALECSKEYNLTALFDNDSTVTSPFKDVQLYYGEQFEEWLSCNYSKEMGFIVAIGGANGKARAEISRYLMSKRLRPLSFIHPRAIVPLEYVLNDGVQIMAGATISIDASIGMWSIINHNANVDHDCVIGEGVHIGPGATLAGEITVKDYSFVGAGATVLPRITIGENCIIGAGAVVTKDVPDNTIVVGVPAHYYKDNR